MARMKRMDEKMKKIVITGKNSYIGTNIKNCLLQSAERYTVDEVDVTVPEWKNYDFTESDAVVHVAGIVHRPDVNDWNLYEKVNVTLAVNIAEKARAAGVKQFIFFSTMAVFGVGKRLSPNVIDENTPKEPFGMYGRSKLMAEEKLLAMQSEDFKICVVRPPNVYGKDCRGNYISGFTRIVKLLPAIPKAFENVKQSMIHIDNLSEFIKLLIENSSEGVFMPQDEKSVSAVELMQTMSKAMGKEKKVSRFLGLGISIVRFIPAVKKAYGGIEYSTELSDSYFGKYQPISFDQAIEKTLN